MPPETQGQPQTPHPDQPCESDQIREQSPARRGEPQPLEFDHPDDPAYDSCVDDLDLILSQPISEPDPALKSKSSTDDGSHSPRQNEPVPPSLQDRGKQPRTSEVFQALGSATGDNDQLAESRITWLVPLLLSYASAVTLALLWVLWTGRTSRPAEPPTNDNRQASAESSPRSSEPLTPIPAENHTTPGKTIRIGQLEVTPLAINSAPVELVRLIEPPDYRREDADSLVLRLRVTNISKDHAFAPLDRALIRDQTSPLDRSDIATSHGRTISLFPLAIDSEWLIQGQEFPVLQPGESAETMVASESITDDRLTPEMIWRVRLRTGPYRTDVLAVRFTKDDVSP